MPDVKTFSVLDTVKGRSYPTDEVTIYTDVESLYKVLKLENKVNDETDDDVINEVDKEISTLREKIEESALTFHLRGFSYGVWDSIDKETTAKFGEDADFSKGEAASWRSAKFISESIIKVVNAEGQEDPNRWSPEDVLNLQAHIPVNEYSKISARANLLSLSSLEFEQALTPDFS